MKRTLAIFLTTFLSACGADKDYGSATPYGATVPAGWTQSIPRDKYLSLGENDALWIPETQPEGRVPAQALIFCAAQPVKNALSTHCDLERILGWTNHFAQRLRPTHLCNNRRAEKIESAGNFEGRPAIARAVRTVDSQGEVYLALYVRKLSQSESFAAVKSIWTICPFKNR